MRSWTSNNLISQLVKLKEDFLPLVPNLYILLSIPHVSGMQA